MQRRGSQEDSLQGKKGKITAHYRNTLQDNLHLSLGRVWWTLSQKQPAPYSDQWYFKVPYYGEIEVNQFFLL